ncbi:hypothetical protein RIE95_09680 [Acidithiobacillus thiooxidans]|uniref:hypothetical protein n=1 Tax=Acidithiobacillus thiooxidans TaxID=930 RepID=UPI00285D814C|nr:hypothetical protein [Acidithiobacillus thiooxidans]MDR7927248.1 hypothetical protein [Acidithiobacillus thiooxidans]
MNYLSPFNPDRYGTLPPGLPSDMASGPVCQSLDFLRSGKLNAKNNEGEQAEFLANNDKQAAILARAIFEYEYERKSRAPLREENGLEFPPILTFDDPELIRFLDTAREIYADDSDRWGSIMDQALKTVENEADDAIAIAIALPESERERRKRDIDINRLTFFEEMSENMHNGFLESQLQKIFHNPVLRDAPGTVWKQPGNGHGTPPVLLIPLSQFSPADGPADSKSPADGESPADGSLADGNHPADGENPSAAPDRAGNATPLSLPEGDPAMSDTEQTPATTDAGLTPSAGLPELPEHYAILPQTDNTFLLTRPRAEPGQWAPIWDDSFAAPENGQPVVGAFPNPEQAAEYAQGLADMAALRQALLRHDAVTLGGVHYVPAFDENNALIHYQADSEGVKSPLTDQWELAQYAHTGIPSPDMVAQQLQAQQASGTPLSPFENLALERFATDAARDPKLTANWEREINYLILSGAKPTEGRNLELSDLPQITQDFVRTRQMTELSATLDDPESAEPAANPPSAGPSARQPFVYRQDMEDTDDGKPHTVYLQNPQGVWASATGEQFIRDFATPLAADAFIQQLQAHAPLLDALQQYQPVTIAGVHYQPQTAENGYGYYRPQDVESPIAGQTPSAGPSARPSQDMVNTWELECYLATGTMSPEIAAHALNHFENLSDFDKENLHHFALEAQRDPHFTAFRQIEGQHYQQTGALLNPDGTFSNLALTDMPDPLQRFVQHPDIRAHPDHRFRGYIFTQRTLQGEEIPVQMRDGHQFVRGFNSPQQLNGYMGFMQSPQMNANRAALQKPDGVIALGRFRYHPDPENPAIYQVTDDQGNRLDKDVSRKDLSDFLFDGLIAPDLFQGWSTHPALRDPVLNLLCAERNARFYNSGTVQRGELPKETVQTGMTENAPASGVQREDQVLNLPEYGIPMTPDGLVGREIQPEGAASLPAQETQNASAQNQGAAGGEPVTGKGTNANAEAGVHENPQEASASSDTSQENAQGQKNGGGTVNNNVGRGNFTLFGGRHTTVHEAAAAEQGASSGNETPLSRRQVNEINHVLEQTPFNPNELQLATNRIKKEGVNTETAPLAEMSLQRAQDFVSDPQRSDQDLDAINRTERGVKNLQKAIHQAPDSPEKESLMKKIEEMAQRFGEALQRLVDRIFHRRTSANLEGPS